MLRPMWTRAYNPAHFCMRCNPVLLRVSALCLHGQPHRQLMVPWERWNTVDRRVQPPPLLLRQRAWQLPAAIPRIALTSTATTVTATLCHHILPIWCA